MHVPADSTETTPLSSPSLLDFMLPLWFETVEFYMGPLKLRVIEIIWKEINRY